MPPPPSCISELLRVTQNRGCTMSVSDTSNVFAIQRGCPRAKEELDVTTILARHAYLFWKKYMQACDWNYEAHDRVVTRRGRVLCLVWPWEVSSTTDPDAIPCYRMHTNDVRVLRMNEYCNEVQRQVYLFNGNTHSRHIKSHHDCLVVVPSDSVDECAVMDMVSRVTDDARHKRFVEVRKSDVTLLALDGTETLHCCNAVVAHSTKGGLLRFYAPDQVMVDRKGFVSDGQDILYRPPTTESARRGGIVFHPPPTAEVVHLQMGTHIIQNLTDDDLIAEATRYTSVQQARVHAEMRDDSMLETHGLTHTATRAGWPYRLLLCRLISRITSVPVHYTEHRPTDCDGMISVSSEMVRVTPHGDMETVSTVYQQSSDSLLVLWDGIRWALLK